MRRLLPQVVPRDSGCTLVWSGGNAAGSVRGYIVVNSWGRASSRVRAGVKRGEGQLGVAAAAGDCGPPAAAAADGHKGGSVASSPSLASSSEEE